MAILNPQISEGPCSAANPGPCYFPSLSIVGGSPGVFVDAATAHPNIDAAVDTLVRKLRSTFQAGDTVTWRGQRHSDLPAAIAAIEANPVTTPI